MRRLIPVLLVGLLVGWSSPSGAQVPQWVSQLLDAAQLPVATAEARREGVFDRDIRAILDAMRRAGVAAHDATPLIDTARVVHRDYGPVDNFGAFVQSQLAAGKRGTALAAAIRAEHARAGKGNAASGAPGAGRGMADTARGASGRGRSTADSVRRGEKGTQPPGARGAPDKKQDNRGRGRPPNR